MQNGKFSRLGNDSPPYPHLSFITYSTHHSKVAVMVPEKNCWMRARAVKVPTVSGVQESLQTMLIVLLPKKSKKNPEFYEVPTMYGNLGTNGGLAKFWGLQPPSPPLAPSLKSGIYKLHCGLGGGEESWSNAILNSKRHIIGKISYMSIKICKYLKKSQKSGNNIASQKSFKFFETCRTSQKPSRSFSKLVKFSKNLLKIT